MRIPELGILGVEQSAKIPSNAIDNPQSIGEHVKKRRLQLRLLQADVAKICGVCEDSITGWENGRSQPQIRYYPKIIQFLEYCPFANNNTTLGNKIRTYRFENGLSIKNYRKLQVM